MGIVAGGDLDGSMADTASGSECDIINHGGLPAAWMPGISVSQTVKGCERPRVWGVGEGPGQGEGRGLEEGEGLSEHNWHQS